jgi:hypothetical protein
MQKMVGTALRAFAKDGFRCTQPALWAYFIYVL